MDNALDPNLMSAAERLTEIGEILAAGLLRLRVRQHEAGDRERRFPGLPRQPERPCEIPYAQRKRMENSVLAQLAALPSKTTPELKQLWRDLYDREPPPYNKPFLVKRLAYRIQELAYGGLSARAEAKLKELVEEEDRRLKGKQPVRKGDRPIAGTRLIREWQGVEHCATVLDDGFEYQGRRYKSLSAIARAITGTRWNGPAFFGLAQLPERQVKAPVRKVRCAIYTRYPRTSAWTWSSIRSTPSARRHSPTSRARSTKAGSSSATATTTAASPAARMERPALQRLLRDVESGVIDVIVVYKVDRLKPLAHRLRKDCRSIRQA